MGTSVWVNAGGKTGRRLEWNLQVWPDNSGVGARRIDGGESGAREQLTGRRGGIGAG